MALVSVPFLCICPIFANLAMSKGCPSLGDEHGGQLPEVPAPTDYQPRDKVKSKDKHNSGERKG